MIGKVEGRSLRYSELASPKTFLPLQRYSGKSNVKECVVNGRGRMVNPWVGSWVTALMVLTVAVVTACGSEEPATPTPIEVTTTEATASVSPTPASIPTLTPTSAPTPTPTKTPTPTIAASPQPTEQPPSTATPTATATPVAPYDSNAIMHSLSGDILSDSFYYSSALDKQLAAIREHRDLSQVPVLIELMRFRIGLDINAVLEELTGQNFGGN